MEKTMTLTDQVAVVTGASSGIGSATARSLSRAGMKLVLTARREKQLNEVSSELDDSVVVAGDITDPGFPAQLIDEATKAFGRCDVVVNNAGVLELGRVEEVDVERICRMVRINTEAAFRMAYVALKHFKSVKRGQLVNVSSILGTKVRPTAGAYAGTKYAIEALSEALRMELAGSNIRVSCVEPGLVMTELHDHMEVHPRETLKVSRPLEPEDIARSIRFVLEQPAHVLIPKVMVLPADQEI